MTPVIASTSQLKQWAQSGAEPFFALGDSPALLWQADDTTDEEQLVAAWLRSLPCPVIAVVTADQDNAWTRASDVLLRDAASATPLLTNIQRSPIASTILVQVLRITENLSVADALVAESLAYSSLQSGPEFRRWRDAHEMKPAVATQHDPAVLIERAGDQLSLILNRPARRNAMSVEMRDALVEALRLVIADGEIQGVQISGRGACFSSGGDLDEFGSAPDPATAHIVRSLCLPGALLARCAARVSVHVHGACIGSGIEFPAFAHRIVATPDAWFQLPELRYGLIPGAGGCVSIARRIGRQRSAWLALSGERIDARTALNWRLIDTIS